jgi:serine/threonine-protein kinase
VRDDELTSALLSGGAVSDGLAASLQRAIGDGYRIDRELGRGGMSRVFVPGDLTLDRDVVVKVLFDETTSGVSADRIRREPR